MKQWKHDLSLLTPDGPCPRTSSRPSGAGKVPAHLYDPRRCLLWSTY